VGKLDMVLLPEVKKQNLSVVFRYATLGAMGPSYQVSLSSSSLSMDRVNS
jgi:hypothetical protein